LGLNGPSEVKNHPWLRNFPWNELKKQSIKAPFLPPVTFLDIILHNYTEQR